MNKTRKFDEAKGSIRVSLILGEGGKEKKGGMKGEGEERRDVSNSKILSFFLLLLHGGSLVP